MYIDIYQFIANSICHSGQCSSSAHPNNLRIHTHVIIGAGVSIFCICCVIIAAIYWHHRQINNTEKRLTSFSQSSNPPRKSTSAGVRVRSSTSQSPSIETSVNLGLPTNKTPKIETV
jgi:hypothetical protein